MAKSEKDSQALDLLETAKEGADKADKLQKWQATDRSQKWQQVVENCLKAKELGLKNFDLFFYLGISYENLGQIEKAIGYLNEAIKFDQNSRKAHNGLGVCYLNLKEPEKAKKHFTKAIRIDPTHPYTFKLLGDCYLTLKNPLKARQSFDLALTLDNDSAILYDLGISYKKLKEFHKALECFNKARTLGYKDQYRDLLTETGIVYKELAKFDEAIKNFQEIIKLDITDTFALFALGQCYKSKEDFYQAKEYFKQVVNIEDNNFEAFYNLGLCYQQLGYFSEAITNYNKAIEAGDSNYGTFHRLAWCYQQLGYFSEAITNYNKAIEAGDSNYGTFHRLAWCYQQLGYFNDAIVNYEKSIELKSKDSWTYYNLGECYWEVENQSRALELFQEALNRDLSKFYKLTTNFLDGKMFPRHEIYMAEAIKKAIDFNTSLIKSITDKIVETYDSSIGGTIIVCSDPGDNYVMLKAHQNLGRYYQESGEFSNAVEHYTKIMEMSFKNSYITAYRLGACHYELNNKEEGLKYFQESLLTEPLEAYNLILKFLKKKDFLEAKDNIYKLIMENIETCELEAHYAKANPKKAEYWNSQATKGRKAAEKLMELIADHSRSLHTEQEVMLPLTTPSKVVTDSIIGEPTDSSSFWGSFEEHESY